VRIILDAEVLSEGAFCCSFAKGSPEPIGWSNHLCNFRAVSGCSSNPEAINLGSSTFPRVLWIRNGTIAT